VSLSATLERNALRLRVVEAMEPRPPLRRLRDGKMVGGVCTGLARRLDLDVGWIRALFVIGTVIPIIPGLPLYLLLWWLVPRETSSGTRRGDPAARPPAGSRRAAAAALGAASTPHDRLVPPGGLGSDQDSEDSSLRRR
jgi:phage shock protein PspC (stress-responsive transcriptional regulator)